MKNNDKLTTPLLALLSGVLSISSPVYAASLSFSEVATQADTGISYQRTESPRIESLKAIQARGFAFPDDPYNSPLKPRGAPGVAIFDFDGDSDLDIFVTNGPGTANNLYANQYSRTGRVSFVDVGAKAGVGLTNHDNSGVCYGDIDNDGDQDLLVLSSGDGNSLFENNGNGTFSLILEGESLGNGNATSCSMGDINNDGLLDIAIANTFEDWSNFGPLIRLEDSARVQHNQLMVNIGNNHFADRSQAAGITNYKWISWAIALVDYDLDGDADLIVGDDQASVPNAAMGGTDVGYLRVYNNNGKGYFTDVTEKVGTNRAGGWMGLAFADYDSDGFMDIFATNFGDYMAAVFGRTVGELSSGWYLGSQSGDFSWPGVGELKATPFGWGVSAMDFDNDADTDVVFHGGLDMGPFAEAGNPGIFLLNDGDANFTFDAGAVDHMRHLRREVMGVATGDLNNDGLTDVVSVSAQDWDESAPLAPMNATPLGGSFDQYSFLWPTFIPDDPQNMFNGMSWSGIDANRGSLSVEINQTASLNNWVKVKLMGTKGLVKYGRANRDGIGAVLQFTPDGEKTAMKPVVGGASYASQNSLATIFGLNDSQSGMLEVLWPGGTKNKFYQLRKNETVMIPEIPCSYNSQMSVKKYTSCVQHSLIQLYRNGTINAGYSVRLYHSAIKAYHSIPR